MRMLQMLVLPLIVSSLITGEKPFLLLSAKAVISKEMLAVVGVPLGERCWISLANSDKPKCTTWCFQHLSTNKDFILHNLQCQKVGCPSQLQVSSSLGKVNLCQSKRAGVDHCVESLFHPGPCRRHASQPSFQTAEEFHLLRHPTIRALKVQCTGRGLFPF